MSTTSSPTPALDLARASLATVGQQLQSYKDGVLDDHELRTELLLLGIGEALVAIAERLERPL
jgi:hypothetical protein